jgi:hypothetical protein
MDGGVVPAEGVVPAAVLVGAAEVAVLPPFAPQAARTKERRRSAPSARSLLAWDGEAALVFIVSPRLRSCRCRPGYSRS